MSGNIVIFRAGILPYYVESDLSGTIEFMFMKPSDPTYGGPDWQIAKGRVENDDSNLVTALREGAEELGLRESNIIEIQELGTYLGRTVIYLCRVFNKEDFDDFHYETGAVNWCTSAAFNIEGRELHKRIVEDAEAIIRTGQYSS